MFYFFCFSQLVAFCTGHGMGGSCRFVQESNQSLQHLVVWFTCWGGSINWWCNIGAGIVIESCSPFFFEDVVDVQEVRGNGAEAVDVSIDACLKVVPGKMACIDIIPIKEGRGQVDRRSGVVGV